MRNRYSPTAAALVVCSAAATLIAFAAEPTDPNSRCLSRLKEIGFAVRMYSEDYDDRLPLMKTIAQLKGPVSPYLRQSREMICPATKQPYQPNAALSGKVLKKIQNPAATVLMRDAKPHPDGLWTVVYVDGHVTREKRMPGGK